MLEDDYSEAVRTTQRLFATNSSIKRAAEITEAIRYELQEDVWKLEGALESSQAALRESEPSKHEEDAIRRVEKLKTNLFLFMSFLPYIPSTAASARWAVEGWPTPEKPLSQATYGH